MEGEIYRTCLDPALNFLEKLHQDSYNSWYCILKSPMEMMILELKFLKMFCWSLAYLEEFEYGWHLHFSINTMMHELSRLAKEFEADCLHVYNLDPTFQSRGMINWGVLIYDLKKAIQQFKPQVKDICMFLLGCVDFKRTSRQPNQKVFLNYGRDTAAFLNFILLNLKALLNSSYSVISPLVKQQIVLILRELEEFGVFVDPVSRLYDIIYRTRTWNNRIAWLTCLFWIDGKIDSLASTMEIFLSLLYKTMPCITSGLISSYFHCTTIPQLLACYLDFLLGDLVVKNNGILQEGLVFLLSFILDPPDDDLEDSRMIWAQIYGVIDKFPILVFSILSSEMEGGFFEADFSGFLLEVETVKAKVRKLYLVAPYSLQFTSLYTCSLSFLNSLIENLKNMLDREVILMPSLKRPCELLLKELVLLRPVVKKITELIQDGKQEIQDLCREIINLIFNANFVIKFCPAMSFSVWYGIIAIPNVLEEIYLIKIRIEDIGFDYLESKKKIVRTGHFPPQATTSNVEGDFIGFGEDERVISDELIGGRDSLTIISISGSGGQGKTTLAKRIHNNPNIQYHFHKIVWCYVSKDWEARELLLQIIHDVDRGDGRKFDDEKNFDMQDLVEHLWRGLKGRRYLIVMDDIWDIDAWHKLEGSFPDEKNGSRILFTSRNHDLASQTNPNSICHPLPLFTDKESWELMKMKCFCSDDCPLEFSEIGKRIASYCKGLPLAVVLIAAILGRIGENLDMWSEVAENLKSHLAREGCGNIIELSFTYLPNDLKWCFLYFGAFPRGESIRAKKLKLLWIGEGFIIPNGEMRSSIDLATDYLNTLVSLSLVSVTLRSSLGGIKRCNVHDLLYDLCLIKSKEYYFSDWAEESLVLDQRHTRKYRHNRLCIGKSDPFIKPRPIVIEKELPTSSVHSLLWSDNPYGGEISLRFLKSFKILTVLDMDFPPKMLANFGNEFPEVILSNVHLRYLALKFWFNIGPAIPPAIANLWNLETLIIGFSDGGPMSLPISMWKMRCLRRVDISSGRIDWKEFKKNPNFFASYNIETLGSLDLCEEDDSTIAAFLQNFPSLRKLDIEFSERRHISKLFSMVGSLLTRLESLKVIGCGEWYNKNPTLWDFPKIENLKKLKLNICSEVSWSVVSKIGKQLPNLQVLKLLNFSCEGDSCRLEVGDFLKILYLKLHSPDIKEIDVSGCDENPPFPCLEHLVVEQCRKLEEIPSIFGEIYSLKSIKVSGCGAQVGTSAMQIFEQQRELGNDNLQVMIEDN